MKTKGKIRLSTSKQPNDIVTYESIKNRRDFTNDANDGSKYITPYNKPTQMLAYHILYQLNLQYVELVRLYITNYR